MAGKRKQSRPYSQGKPRTGPTPPSQSRSSSHSGARSQAQAANGRRREKKRSGNKVLHYALLILFLAAVGVVLSLTTFFKIEQILVVGTDKYTPAEIIAASGIHTEDNLFRVNAALVEETLLDRFPYIQSVVVRRKLPPAIELRVTQSVPAAAVLENNEVILITKEGKVLERGDLFIPTNVPVVKGLEVGSTKPGETLGQELEEKLAEKPSKKPEGAEKERQQAMKDELQATKDGLRMLIYLFDALRASDFGRVTNVDLSDRLNMKIIYENRYLFLLGTEADLPYKLDMLREIIAQEPADGEGRIDVGNAGEKEAIIKDVTLEEALALTYGTDGRSKPDEYSDTQSVTADQEDNVNNTD